VGTPRRSLAWPGRRRLRRSARRLPFALLPAAALLAALELIARGLGGGALDAGGPLGWTTRPALSGHLVAQPPPREDFEVRTNADGLRTGYGRAAGDAARLVTFGDSTICGWGLAEAGAPAAALESSLGPGYEVINAGQPGYSSEQARRLAEALLPAYTPRGVVWFHPWHDVAAAEHTDRSVLPPTPPWWAASRFLQLLAGSRDRARLTPRDDPLFPFVARTAPGGAVTRVPPPEREDNVRRVVAAARAAGAWTVVALLPNELTLADSRPSPLALELDALCAQLDVPFVDAAEALRGEPLSAVTLPGDTGHFTAAANARLVAPVAAAILQQEGTP